MGVPDVPRPPASEDAILRATIDILAAHGVGGLAVDTVATAAGVSKATIYRRWGSRTDLIYAAIVSLGRPMPDPDTGSLRTDLIALLGQLITYVGHDGCGPVFASFIEAAAREPRLDLLRRTQLAELRVAYARVLGQGVDRGELASAVDVDLLVDLLMAPVIYRAQIERAPLPGGYAEALVDRLLGAFGHVRAP
jgi:AcrR family transcriptional regulator